MKTSIVVLLSCVVLAASLESKTPYPRNEQCASTCLWAGVYNLPSFQSCNRFLQCIHGFLFEFECGAGEEFDHLTMLCQRAELGRCALRGPVTSSEETSEGTSEEITAEEVNEPLRLY